MNPRIAAGSLLIAMAAVAAGCAARHFSQMQSEFETLLDKKAACYPARPAAAEARSPVECLSDYDVPIASIATEAEKAAGEIKDDEAMKVGLYRLAAMAYWQAGAVYQTKAAAVVDKAAPLCDSSRPKGGPRDCALIELLPGLMELDQATRDLNHMQVGIRSANTAEDRLKLSTSVAKGMTEFLKPWETFNERAKKSLAMQGVPPGLNEYIKVQRKRGFCSYQNLDGELAGVFDDVQRLDTSADCPGTAVQLSESARMRPLLEQAKAKGLSNLTAEGHRAKCAFRVVEIQMVAIDSNATALTFCTN